METKKRYYDLYKDLFFQVKFFESVERLAFSYETFKKNAKKIPKLKFEYKQTFKKEADFGEATYVETKLDDLIKNFLNDSSKKKENFENRLKEIIKDKDYFKIFDPIEMSFHFFENEINSLKEKNIGKSEYKKEVEKIQLSMAKNSLRILEKKAKSNNWVSNEDLNKNSKEDFLLYYTDFLSNYLNAYNNNNLSFIAALVGNRQKSRDTKYKSIRIKKIIEQEEKENRSKASQIIQAELKERGAKKLIKDKTLGKIAFSSKDDLSEKLINIIYAGEILKSNFLEVKEKQKDLTLNTRKK